MRIAFLLFAAMLTKGHSVQSTKQRDGNAYEALDAYLRHIADSTKEECLVSSGVEEKKTEAMNRTQCRREGMPELQAQRMNEIQDRMNHAIMKERMNGDKVKAAMKETVVERIPVTERFVERVTEKYVERVPVTEHHIERVPVSVPVTQRCILKVTKPITAHVPVTQQHIHAIHVTHRMMHPIPYAVTSVETQRLLERRTQTATCIKKIKETESVTQTVVSLASVTERHLRALRLTEHVVEHIPYAVTSIATQREVRVYTKIQRDIERVTCEPLPPASVSITQRIIRPYAVTHFEREIQHDTVTQKQICVKHTTDTVTIQEPRVILKPQWHHETVSITEQLCDPETVRLTVPIFMPMSQTIKRRHVILSYATSLHRLPIMLTLAPPPGITNYIATVSETFIKNQSSFIMITDRWTALPTVTFLG
jgi:hypothetical protein